MINHIRTLLQNSAANTAVGAEYIEPGFQPVRLDGWMTDIQNVLMPSGMTDYQRNLRTLSLLQLLHQPDLLPYVLLLDPRITYSLSDNYFKRLQLAGLTVTKYSTATTDIQPVFYGDQDPRDLKLTAGTYEWRYTPAYEGTNIVAEWYRGRVRERDLVFSGVTSNHLTLLPDYLLVYFQDPMERLTGVFDFKISLQVPLLFDVMRMLQRFELLDMQTSVASKVFAPWTSYAEELAALYRIWTQGSEPLVRFGAFTLAYLIQVERLRLGIPVPGGRKPSSVVRVI
jgi:hypothetical protein